MTTVKELYLFVAALFVCLAMAAPVEAQGGRLYWGDYVLKSTDPREPKGRMDT